MGSAVVDHGADHGKKEARLHQDNLHRRKNKEFIAKEIAEYDKALADKKEQEDAHWRY